jgi:hypothetical protein
MSKCKHVSLWLPLPLLEATSCRATSPPFRALIIGIDIYKHAGDTIHNLRGCVADAKNMRQYLIEKWSVSPESIVMLYNEEATRAGILENLRALKHPGVLRGAPIFIFWAGHGSRAHAASTSSIGNVFVEMLIPHDFDPKNEDKNGQGLPDFILGSEVAEIARHNGDNIASDTSCFRRASADNTFMHRP